MVEFRSFRSDVALLEEAAAHIVREVRDDLTRNATTAFMVSGGSTPRAVMPLVASAALDWERVVVYASDERCVANDHPDSTSGMIRGIFANAGRRPRYIAPETPDSDGAEQWWRQIATFPEPAVAYIGIGPDGHTASIFPGSKADRDMRAGAFWTSASPPHDHARISLTIGALARAKTIILIANTAEKLTAFHQSEARAAAVTHIMKSPGNRFVYARESD